MPGRAGVVPRPARDLGRSRRPTTARPPSSRGCSADNFAGYADGVRRRDRRGRPRSGRRLSVVADARSEARVRRRLSRRAGRRGPGGRDDRPRSATMTPSTNGARLNASGMASEDEEQPEQGERGRAAHRRCLDRTLDGSGQQPDGRQGGAHDDEQLRWDEGCHRSTPVAVADRPDRAGLEPPPTIDGRPSAHATKDDRSSRRVRTMPGRPTDRKEPLPHGPQQGHRHRRRQRRRDDRAADRRGRPGGRRPRRHRRGPAPGQGPRSRRGGARSSATTPGSPARTTTPTRPGPTSSS